MPERNCKTCKRQAEWGCYAVETDEIDPFTGEKVWRNPALLPLTLDDENVWRCPRRPIKDDPLYWQKLLFHYGLYKSGFLQDEGGVTSQSFKAMVMFGIIDDAMAECGKEKAERETARQLRSAP
jgi:hypothetical protein